MSVDERTKETVRLGLADIESLLRDLAERQRLSRFDNLVLLFYPVFLALAGWVIPGLFRYEALEETYGYWYARVVGTLPWVLIVGAGAGFIMFLHAYFHDELWGRIDGCSILVVLAPLYFAGYLMFQYGWTWVFSLPVFTNELLFSWILLLAGYLIAGSFIFDIALGPRRVVRHFLASWCERNVPRMYVAAQRPYAGKVGWRRVEIRNIVIELIGLAAIVGLFLAMAAGSTCGIWVGLYWTTPMWCSALSERAAVLVVLVAVAVVFFYVARKRVIS